MDISYFKQSITLAQATEVKMQEKVYVNNKMIAKKM